MVTIIRDTNEVTITRENDQFKQIMQFNVNKKTISEYYIKEMNTSLEFNIFTIKLINKKNYIYIEYIIEETNEEYKYELLYKEEL